ncbi:MAG TPA: dihydroneopterin aldolase [Flavisolibacter sp.]|nr:dihydroneopterin aldolase [Flavisolibacter sp.]
MASFTIQLHRLRFFGYHGLYEEEAMLGSDFEINLSIETVAPEYVVVKIEDTINYAAVYEIVRRIFSQREALLETITMNMAAAIKDEFPLLKKISIQLTKLHPPIAAFTGSVSVTFNKEYES